jgi:hypothetical protein
MAKKKTQFTLRDLVDKVNSDKKVRADFLKDPVGMLRDSGVTLSEGTQKEIKSIISEYAERYPSMGEVPDPDELENIICM